MLLLKSDDKKILKLYQLQTSLSSTILLEKLRVDIFFLCLAISRASFGYFAGKKTWKVFNMQGFPIVLAFIWKSRTNKRFCYIIFYPANFDTRSYSI